MDERALQAFLARTGEPTFRKYLLAARGHTMSECLERRLRWAELHWGVDPAAEEARFLLHHRASLRKRARELERLYPAPPVPKALWGKRTLGVGDETDDLILPDPIDTLPRRSYYLAAGGVLLVLGLFVPSGPTDAAPEPVAETAEQAPSVDVDRGTWLRRAERRERWSQAGARAAERTR